MSLEVKAQVGLLPPPPPPPLPPHHSGPVTKDFSPPSQLMCSSDGVTGCAKPDLIQVGNRESSNILYVGAN